MSFLNKPIPGLKRPQRIPRSKQERDWLLRAFPPPQFPRLNWYLDLAGFFSVLIFGFAGFMILLFFPVLFIKLNPGSHIADFYRSTFFKLHGEARAGAYLLVHFPIAIFLTMPMTRIVTLRFWGCEHLRANKGDEEKIN